MLKRFIALFSLIIITACSTSSEYIIPDSDIKKQSIKSSKIELEQHTLNIALVVPLGKQNHIGSSLVKAAQLALSDSNNKNTSLTIIDSNLLDKSQDTLLKKLKDSKIQVVVGPLYGNETLSMVSLLKNHDITVLSLSNDTSISSDFLLIMGVSPDSQASAITNYAIGKGVEHFHLILPKNKFGQLIDNTVENIVLDKNNITHSINWYNQDNAETVINELVSGIDNNKTQSIFMPQAGENLNFLNNALAKYKLNNVTVLGLQSWDNLNILELKSLNNSIFLRKNIAESGFYDNYSRTFNLAATNIDFITYNSIMMLINMHRDQLALDKRTIIENNKNYGKYSDVIFNQNGISFYKLSVAKIENREFKTLENVP